MSLRDAFTAIQREHQRIEVGIGCTGCSCHGQYAYPLDFAARVSDRLIAYLRDNLVEHAAVIVLLLLIFTATTGRNT